jgi:NAD(P)-dependent dehydrogenase (short-subunit alcohol dehydrogenase family)
MNAAKFTIPPVQFPTHSQPRVWLITGISSPIGIALARQVLAHGDSLVAGIEKIEMWHKDDDRGEECRRLWDDVEREGWKHRCRIVAFDGRCEPSSFATLDFICIRLS